MKPTGVCTHCRRLLLVLAAAIACAELQPLSAAQPDPESPAAREARLAWFREAKFGLFIHWGLYSIPAGYWKGEHAPGIGEWIMKRKKIPAREYERLAGGFNPIKFDAEAWAQLAADAGMKYVVITTKHHDGFAMFHSKVSPYNIVDATPFHRDPIKELAAACAKRGLRLGFYYSQAQDWHAPGGAGNEWDFGPDAEKDKNGAYDKYLREKAEPQVRELLTNYGPVGLIWFDTPVLMTPERGQRFVDIVRATQPDCLIDGRLGTSGDYVSTEDNEIPPEVEAGAWEVPATLNRTWGYRRDDHDWKSPGELVFKLIDIVSKGGNYLLNVGPDAIGVIPQPSQDNLRTVGEWLKLNGEAVYGAGPSPFGEEFGEYSATAKGIDGKPLFQARNDWRCTVKPGKLHFTLFRIGWDGFWLPPFKNRIKSATHINEMGLRVPLKVETLPDGRRRVMISLLSVRDTMGAVVVVEIDGEGVER
jgi:alpha-L-fucosidase